ncbi:helix-turn-helix transcriptional regulator [Auritidibacter ignavus]|uniref:helix-turn-helix transcriptional regulator n=1 Tax=Auritidibacter ignavus TaxID=678932 RepID=UPI003CC5C3BF
MSRAKKPTLAPHDEFLTIDQVAELTNTSRSTVNRRIAEGHLRAFKMGARSVRIRRSDVLGMFTELNPATWELVNGGETQ